MNDFRIAVRSLLKTPGFSILAILTLALGIGANAAIFSAVNGVLLQPLPFSHPDRVVRVQLTTPDGRMSTHSAGDFLDLRRQNQSLASLAGHFQGPISAVTTGPPVPLSGSYVTLDFFDVFGTPAMRGRTFSRERDRVGERVAVLSDEAARQLFGEEDGVGRRVRLNGQVHTILGVMPPRFDWPRGAGVWILSVKEVPPAPVDGGDAPTNYDVGYIDAVARLKQGIAIEQAQQDLSALAARIGREHGVERQGVALDQVHETIVGDVRGALLVLQGAVALVLLIACANISSLLITRGASRRRDLAIRAALGAGKRRLVRQLLAESLVLGTAGGLIGLLLGAWLTAALVRLLPTGVPRVEEIRLDTTVMLVTLGVALMTSILFGILPALQGSRIDAAIALKQTGGRGSSRVRGRAALVVGEIALTLVLLASAGLLINSFLRLQRVDSGMQIDRVTVAGLNLPQTRYTSGASQVQLYDRILEALGRRGELDAVGLGFPLPLQGGKAAGTFYIEGQPAASQRDQPYAQIATVSGGFLSAMGVPLLSGRAFTAADRADAPDVAVVSLALARRYFPGKNPVGRRIKFDADPGAPWMTIVGVAGDVRQLGLHEPPPPIIYMPYQQFPLPFAVLAVRSAQPEGTVASIVRAELASIDMDLPFSRVTTLRSVLERSVEQPRFRTMMLGLFAMLGLALAAVGVYGVISYSVTQRTREIGIRLALGAGPRQVLFPILRDGVLMAVTGLAIGLAGVLATTRLLARFLFAVGTTDPVTFAAVAAILFGVALLASYIPSRRALRVDPMTALRAE